MPRFLFDECVPWQVAKALALVDVPASHVMEIQELGVGATDQQIVEWCEREGVVWVTADLKASKRRKVQLFPALGCIGMAVFSPARSGWTRRQWLGQILGRVDAMEKLYEVNRPVWYRFTSRGDPKLMPIPQP